MPDLKPAILGLSILAWVSLACMPAARTVPTPDPAAGPAGTAWTVTTIGGVAVLPDVPPTMTFGHDARVGGSGGCNQYSGPFRVDGDQIGFGDLQSTLMLCEGERGAQEAAFMDALRGSRTWRLTPEGELVIDGSAAIVARPGVADAPSPAEPAQALPGTRWDLVELGDTADLARLVPTIEFGADGSVAGFAGCNTFHGAYTVDGNAFGLGPLGVTKIGCDRPASAVEMAYLDALAGAMAWSIEPDGRLVLDGRVPLRYAPG